MTAKILLIGLFCSQAFAAESPAYRFSRTIIRSDDNPQSLLAVTLDGPIYAAGAADFHDLRIVDQDGIETPYLLRKITSSKSVVRRLPSRSVAQSLQKTGADGIAVTVELNKDAANADGLTLVTKQKDFEYDIQILASKDGQNWQMLVENAAIYDYSRYMAIGNRDIELPTNNFRRFKIVVDQATQTRTDGLLQLTRTLHGGKEQQRNEKLDLHHEPLHIERIDFWHERTETVPEAVTEFEYRVSGYTISHDAERKTSLIDIDTQRQPLTGFKLNIGTPNFSRVAEVQIPSKNGIKSRMKTIGRATLEALHFEDIQRAQNTIKFPEQRQQHYRIIIADHDNPSLEIKALTGVGNGYQMLFLPQAGSSYRLLYGADDTDPARYDTAPVRELLRRGYQSTAALLGPEIPGEPVSDRLDLAELLNSRLFLGAVIGLMVLVLAWSLYRLGKKIGEIGE